MPDISLSPIPYNNGQLLQGQYQNAHCMIQPGVFLHVVAQSNPSYVYAYVTTLTNYKTGTYSTVASPMRAILSPGSTPAAPTTLNAVRLFKLNNTTAAMLMNGTMYVLLVGSGNDVTLRTGTSLTVGTMAATPNVQGSSGPMYYNQPGYPASGSLWMFHYVRDNCLVGYNRGLGTTAEVSSAIGYKITYDPTSGSLTSSNPFGQTLSSSLTSWGSGSNSMQAQYCTARSHLMDIPGSTTKLFQYRVYIPVNSPNNVGLARSVVSFAALIDSNNNVSALTLPAMSAASTQNVTMMVPLAANRILGFIDNKSYLIYNGTSWSTTPVVFATQTGMTTSNQYSLFEGVALDANYFALYTAPIGQSYDPGSSGSSTVWSMRIGRYVDSGLGQVSPNSANGDGMNVLGISGPQHDQALLFRDGTDTIGWMLRDSSTPIRPAYKIQYQVGG